MTGASVHLRLTFGGLLRCNGDFFCREEAYTPAYYLLVALPVPGHAVEMTKKLTTFFLQPGRPEALLAVWLSVSVAAVKHGSQHLRGDGCCPRLLSTHHLTFMFVTIVMVFLSTNLCCMRSKPLGRCYFV